MVGSSLRGLWRHGDFVKLWAGQTVSVFGTQITMFALPLIAVLTLKATPQQMGLLQAFLMSPFLLFGLLAGVWTDRGQRRPILIAADLLRMVLLGSIPVAALMGRLQMGQIYLIAFLVGTCTLFFDVAYMAYLPALVEPQDLVEGNSKLEMSHTLSQVVGPGLAGVLVRLVTAPVAILLDSISYLVSVFSLLLIRRVEPPIAPSAGRRRLWAEIGEGLQTVFGNRILRAITASTATFNLFANILQAVYLIYVTRILGVTPQALGLVLSIGSISALIATFVTKPMARWLGLGMTLMSCTFISGVSGFLILFTRGDGLLTLSLLGASQAMAGFGVTIYNVQQVSLRQSITPARLQGRMNASVRTIVWGIAPIGALIGGALGEAIGLRSTLLIGAFGPLLSILWLFLSPVRNLREAPTGQAVGF